MKNSHYIYLCLLILFGLTSCQVEENNNNPQKYILVHLGLPEDTSSKSVSNDNMYGINVYYDSSRDGNSNTHYAYGLFDNKEDMSITLLSGYTYKFECTLVKDAKAILYCGQYGGNTFSGYAKPFQTNSSPSTQLTNAFVYGTTYLSGIQSGAATVKSSATGYVDQDMPSIQRYYGEMEGYTPTPGGIVEIPLKRTVFGARIIIDKVPEGRLSASCIVDANNISLLSGIATGKLYDSGAILYSFPDVRDCWAKETAIAAKVNWAFTSSMFDQWNQNGERKISFNRNKLTTVTVSCTPDNSSGDIGFVEEGFGEENNIYLYLNSDGVIVVGVNPDNNEN